MEPTFFQWRDRGFGDGAAFGAFSGGRAADVVSDLIERIAPCPWGAHVGIAAERARSRVADRSKATLYTPEERVRRDRTPWTLVQGVLAPVQFLACAVSIVLIVRFLATGQGEGAAVASVLLKTALLYTIMITGSIWEKVVFGRWLFARAFFWEDVVSLIVLTLQTAYVVALMLHVGSPRAQFFIAMAAYAAYVVNAAQFVLKLRAARLEGSRDLPLGGATA